MSPGVLRGGMGVALGGVDVVKCYLNFNGEVNRMRGECWRRSFEVSRAMYDAALAEHVLVVDAAGPRIFAFTLRRPGTWVYGVEILATPVGVDRKSTRLNSSHVSESRMPSSA